jgi:hypothetical protein
LYNLLKGHPERGNQVLSEILSLREVPLKYALYGLRFTDFPGREVIIRKNEGGFCWFLAFITSENQRSYLATFGRAISCRIDHQLAEMKRTPVFRIGLTLAMAGLTSQYMRGAHGPAGAHRTGHDPPLRKNRRKSHIVWIADRGETRPGIFMGGTDRIVLQPIPLKKPQKAYYSPDTIPPL